MTGKKLSQVLAVTGVVALGALWTMNGTVRADETPAPPAPPVAAPAPPAPPVAAPATDEPIPLPAPWRGRDVGKVNVPGSSVYDEAKKKWTIKSNGTGVTDRTLDSMYFVYQKLSGDGQIMAHFVSMNSARMPQALLMFRNTFKPDSIYVGAGIEDETEFHVPFRFGGGFNGIPDRRKGADMPMWIKLVRKGNLFTCLSSTDGKAWDVIVKREQDMEAEAVVGIAVSTRLESETDPTLATVVLDNVQVVPGNTDPDLDGTKPAPAPAG